MLVVQYNVWKDFSVGFALPALALCIIVRFAGVTRLVNCFTLFNLSLYFLLQLYSSWPFSSTTL